MTAPRFTGILIATILTLTALALTACGGGDGPTGTTSGRKSVAGTMNFVLGSSSGSSSSLINLNLVPDIRPANLVAGAEYIVSPRKAKITFTSVIFRDKDGGELLTSTFSGCNATYDRSLAAKSTLLACSIAMPEGDVGQIAVAYDRTLQILVSDATNGIYSDPSIATGFSTSPPAGGAAYVPFLLQVGSGNERSTSVIFATPISITSASAPVLYITTDMIQTLQLQVNTGGTTLAPTTHGQGSDPVALFASLAPGSSAFYSNANSIESYRVGSVNEYRSLRIFYDQSGNPLYLMSLNTCGILGNQNGSWATPPIGGGVGGWLGRDSNKIIAWAAPSTAAPPYSGYSVYYVMPELTAIGQTTILKCKETAAPPVPADGKTYASGAPAMPSPDRTWTFTLLAK